MKDRARDRTTAAASTQPEPRPWATDEDAKEWRIRYRGRGRPHQVTSTVAVELNAAQSAWLRQEAARTGLTYSAILKRFIDDARASGVQNGSHDAQGSVPDPAAQSGRTGPR